MTRKSSANRNVLAFYEEMPCNLHASVAEQARAVLDGIDVFSLNVPLVPLLTRNARVLDVGCNTGWFANSMALHFDCDVTAIDFNPIALTRAKAVASRLKLETRFLKKDLFLYSPKRKFEIVTSIGVLHHTNDCLGAIRHVVRTMLDKNGWAYLGLYHKYGRRPFLKSFADLKKRGFSDEELYRRYLRLQPKKSHDVHQYSWFRDQVLHPHETQHTLKEIVTAIEAENCELISTSINGFRPIGSRRQLFADERACENVAMNAIRANKFDPGFFTFLIRKN